MNEPWFDPNVWAWLPGTAWGCLAGLWGGVAGVCAQRSKHRRWILGSGIVLVAAAAAFLAAGISGWFVGQPYGVWYGLLLPGVLGMILIPTFLPAMWRRYGEAEGRRIQARDL